MRTNKLHPWNVSAEEAVRIQNDLRGRVKLEDDFGTVSLVAGVDVGYSIAEGTATAAVVVLTFPDLSLVETATATETVEFPYIPGLLSFREAPAILAAFGILTAEPDLLMVDGQGIAHPRRFGIACHIGVLLDKPSIGCGKSRLIGEYSEPGPEPGDSSPLTVKSERVGSVLRTKAGVKPLFISPGNRIGFESADRFVLECVRGYKLPETTRLADRIVSHALPVLATK